MSIESGIYSFLTGSAAIAVIVGDRVYPMLIEQGVDYPAITYQEISNSPEHSQDGYSGITYTRVQINCWSITAIGARNLREVVRMRMDGYAGAMGTIVVQSCFWVGGHDIYEPQPGMEQDRRFGKSMDFMVCHVEVAPTFA